MPLTSPPAAAAVSAEPVIQFGDEDIAQLVRHTMSMDFHGELSPDAFWTQVERSDQRIRDSFADLPCYWLKDNPLHGMIGEWIYEGGPRGIAYGDPKGVDPFIHVRSTHQSPIRTVHNLRNDETSDKVRYFRRLQEVENDEPTRLEIDVDDKTVVFAMWGDERHWWAAAQQETHGIVIEALRMSPRHLRLETVTDIEPYLAERRSWLRQMRHEPDK